MTQRLAIIESRPGLPRQEWLSWLMRDLGLPLEQCFRGYVNDPALASKLVACSPNVVVCLGDEALRAFHPDAKARASNFRGSLFMGALAGAEISTSPSLPESGSGQVTAAGPAPAFPAHEAAVLTIAHGAARDAQTSPASVLIETRNGLLADAHSDNPADGHKVGIPAPREPVAATARSASFSRGDGVDQAQAVRVPDSTMNSASPALSNAVAPRFKCLCVLAPGDPQLRLPEWSPLLRFDLARAIAESASPALTLPARRIDWQLGADEIVQRLDDIRSLHLTVGLDLEGWPASGITDLSLAYSPTHALWIPFRRKGWSNWWSSYEETRILDALRAVIEDVAVKKVCHNALYEMLVFHVSCGWRLRGLSGDTMLKFQELYCELRRNLSTVASLMTRQPYWGEAGDAVTDEQRALYNGIDACVTLEVDAAISALPEWTPAMESHYRSKLALLPAALRQMTHGAKFDLVGRAALVSRLDNSIAERQGKLDALAGIGTPGLREVTETVCARKAWDSVTDWDDIEEHANPSWRKRA